MKTILRSLSAALLMMAAVSSANAVVCADGVRRAECVGREGAVEVRKPEAVVAPREEVVAPRNEEVRVAPEKDVVVAPGREECRMVEGRRVCR